MGKRWRNSSGERIRNDDGERIKDDSCCCEPDPCDDIVASATLGLSLTDAPNIGGQVAYYLLADFAITLPAGYSLCTNEFTGETVDPTDCSDEMSDGAIPGTYATTSSFPFLDIAPTCPFNPDQRAEQGRWHQSLGAPDLYRITADFSIVRDSDETVCAYGSITKYLAVTCTTNGVEWEEFATRAAMCAATFVAGDYPPFLSLHFTGWFHDVSAGTLGGGCSDPTVGTVPGACYSGVADATPLNGAQSYALPLDAGSISTGTFDFGATWESPSGGVFLDDLPKCSGWISCHGSVYYDWTGGEAKVIEFLQAWGHGEVSIDGCTLTIESARIDLTNEVSNPSYEGPLDSLIASDSWDMSVGGLYVCDNNNHRQYFNCTPGAACPTSTTVHNTLGCTGRMANGYWLGVSVVL